MVCRHYGRRVSLPHIREAVGTGVDGTSLGGIRRGGERIGLRVRAVKATKERLDELPLPAIVHWGGTHWVVAYRIAEDEVHVADPARGHRRVGRDEFEAEWSGYVALVEPTGRLREAPEASSAVRWLVPFVRPFGRTLLAAVALAFVAAGLEMLLPVATKVVIDDAIPHRNYGLLYGAVGGMIGVLVLVVCATIVQRYLLARAAVAVDRSSSDYLTERLLQLPVAYFAARRAGDIERRVSGMRQVRRLLVQNGVRALTAATQVGVALVLMLLYSWPLGLLYLATLPVYVALARYSVRRIRPTFEAMEEAFGRYQGRQVDAIRGIETVKSMGAEDGLRRRMMAELDRLVDRLFRAELTMMTYEGLVSVSTFLIVAVFLLAGALEVLHGSLSLGGLVAFNSLVLLASGPLAALLALWDEAQIASVLLGRLQDVFEHEPEQGRDHSALLPVDSLEGRVTLRRVGFRYANAPDSAILSEISLDIPPGTSVALVGRSGSGKTTLVKCLAGLLEPTEGAILFDGRELRSLRYRDLRRKIGFVIQEPYLFDDTIARNIAFGEDEPDLRRVVWAAEVANANEFVQRLPLGYETRVGESGLRLSGGQAQRVAIARAVYHQPPVLLLDEATSSLDTESERLVKENMDKLLTGRTSFVIAHRLSTIRDADLIVVLDQGRIVETGTHAELLQRQGLYFYLHGQQLGG
jgi:ATP-binding cassette subfamily B protein